MSTSNAQHLSAQHPSCRENSKRVEALKRWSRRDDGVASTSPFRRFAVSPCHFIFPPEGGTPNNRDDASLRGGEADDLLFAPDGEGAFCRRQESFLDVFPGAGNKIAAATHVELAFDVFAMALDRLYTEMK
jgi:hypothetical protein